MTRRTTSVARSMPLLAIVSTVNHLSKTAAICFPIPVSITPTHPRSHTAIVLELHPKHGVRHNHLQNSKWLCMLEKLVFRFLSKYRAVAQLGSAPRSGRGGRGFKSRQPDFLWVVFILVFALLLSLCFIVRRHEMSCRICPIFGARLIQCFITDQDSMRRTMLLYIRRHLNLYLSYLNFPM